MKYLLDTHILLWANTDDEKLSAEIKKIYTRKSNDLYISKASLWEMAIKSSRGKLNLGEPLKSYVKNHVAANQITTLDISAEHIYELENLPDIHRDPFDRLLIAQCLVEDIPLLSDDPQIKEYGIEVIS